MSFGSSQLGTTQFGHSTSSSSGGSSGAQSIPLNLSGHIDQAAQSVPLGLAGYLTQPAQAILLDLEGIPGIIAQTIPLALAGHIDQPAQSVPLDLSGKVPFPAQTIPLALSGSVGAAAQSLPLRLKGLTATVAQSIPLTLSAYDASAVTAPGLIWGLSVLVDGADISDRISGDVLIEQEETASGYAELRYLPGTGVIDPEQYEGKSVSIDWRTFNAAGVETSRFRRFTGIVEEAAYEAESAEITLRCTTDLQTRLDGMTREQIDTLIGGYWSEHIFDDSASGWDYAQDQLSTIPSELHVTTAGALSVVPFAAKATPDITITGDERYAEPLPLQRVSKRDMITRFVINLDFRFVKLRHRQMAVRLIDIPFCEYLKNNFPLPSRSMVSSAADSGAWTRISKILFKPLPATGTYCSGRNWANDPSTTDGICLGASWTSARRWAQTVTEQYELSVTAPDLAETIGDQEAAADYGIEATYDATEYEQIDTYTSEPSGSVYNPASGDYEAEATAAEQDGRLAMADAQECAIAMARTEILQRARGNRLPVQIVYRPDMDISKTVRIEATRLTTQGKVAASREILNPTTARMDMTITLAISRHGGSGVAVDSPVQTAPQPATPPETAGSRYHAVGLRLGAKAGAIPDADDLEGYMVNVAINGDDYDPSAETYGHRLSITLPEIEDAARQAVNAPQSTTYTVAVPEDTLIMEA